MKKKKNGFILLSTLILINLLMITCHLLTQSTLIQTQTILNQYHETKVHYHALSALPFIPDHIPHINTLTHQPTKDTLYINKSYPLQLNLSSTHYLTKTQTHIYCTTLLNSTA